MIVDLSRQTDLTVEVDHTLVVSGIIDVVNSGIMNIVQNALQINGEPVVLTAGELNYLQGATSNVQTQLDSLNTTISGVGLVGTWFDNIMNKKGSYSDPNTCIFYNVNIASDFHIAGEASNKHQWLFFINGILVDVPAITSIRNQGNDVVIDVSAVTLKHILKPRHDFVLWGPLVSI